MKNACIIWLKRPRLQNLRLQFGADALNEKSRFVLTRIKYQT